MDDTRKKAILYCRVSSKKQVSDGTGLDSQEHRIRQYAATRGYAVEKVFLDDTSGGGDFMNRRGMVELLKYLSKHRHDHYVVIFDDLKRFARDTRFHLTLRERLAAYGATVECPNFKFEDTPEGEFVETVVAAQGALERKQIARQTIQKMKARLEQGYFVFRAPVGYRYEAVKGRGKMLVRNEPWASIVKEALEGFAFGRFQTQTEVKRFLESHAEYPRGTNGALHGQRVADLLSSPTYAGYVEAPNWKVSLRQGHHEPLISYETFRKIQDCLEGKAGVPYRKDLKADFPLRGFVDCGHCGCALTASWSKGRTAEYPYYLCVNRACASYGKSIRRDQIERDFTEVLKRLQPSQSLVEAACAMFRDLWNHRLASGEARGRALKKELTNIEKQVGQLLDRITETTVPSVITAYENRIRKLEEQKLLLIEKIETAGRPLRSFDEALRTAMEFLASPWKLWSSEVLEQRRTVLKLAFADRLAYARNEGFRTANLSLPFRMLQSLCDPQNVMASPTGFEPVLPP